LLACNGYPLKNEPAETAKTSYQTDKSEKKTHFNLQDENYRMAQDTLNLQEANFLKEISQQNGFLLLSNKVKRYYDKNDKNPIANVIVYSNDSLIKNGYVEMELEFMGNISTPQVYYTYNLGQASTGYGSVVGLQLDDYLHSFKSCGITNCIISVFNNRKQIIEQTADASQ
jgi:hypothetical protein